MGRMLFYIFFILKKNIYYPFRELLAACVSLQQPQEQRYPVLPWVSLFCFGSQKRKTFANVKVNIVIEFGFFLFLSE